jgi:hypothetical protein
LLLWSAGIMAVTAPCRRLELADAARITAAFDEVLADNGTRIIKTPVRSPRANSFAERYV